MQLKTPFFAFVNRNSIATYKNKKPHKGALKAVMLL
jgi:hypothetical protein